MRPVDKVPDIFFKNPLRTAISYLLLSDLQQKKEISLIFFRGVSLIWALAGAPIPKRHLQNRAHPPPSQRYTVQGGEPSDFANFHFRRRRWPGKVTHGSIAHESRAHQSTSERTNRRWTMYRWLFEVGGGHGPTKWTRRRTADTRPSGGDLVDVPNAARGSEKVTQEKNPSRGNKVCTFFEAEKWVPRGRW